MLQLEGGYVVLYDELEAKKPIKWTTQFHAPYYTIEVQKTENNNQQNFTVKTDLGSVNAAVFANSPLKMTVHNKFFETATNWNNVTNDEGKIKEFKDQWHAGITSVPAQKFRFLTIIQIKDGKPELIKTINASNGLYHIEVGEWNIQVQLDGAKPVALQVLSKQSKSLFNYGNLPVNFQGKAYAPKIAGSSMLFEMDGNKLNKQEVIDELPAVAKYDRN